MDDRETNTKEPRTAVKISATSREAIEKTVFPVGKDGITNDQFALIADAGNRRSLIDEDPKKGSNSPVWFGLTVFPVSL